MRVFVTGASGHIGSALVPELLAADHKVIGLARTDGAAARVASYGAEVHRGDLDDVDNLADAAASADGVIHLAFRHDLNDIVAASAIDLRAVQAMGARLEGTGKPFVVTSGTLFLAVTAAGRVGTEHDAYPAGPRADSENAVLALADRGVRSSAVRLAPLVHSTLDHHGFTHRLIGIARDTGVSGYVGDGANRWPALHTLDAARLFRLALEQAPAGARLHGVADQGVPFKDIAEVIGRHLQRPAASIAAQDVAAHFGFLAAFAGWDNPTSSAYTQELLGWRPSEVGLLADLELGHYFA